MNRSEIDVALVLDSRGFGGIETHVSLLATGLRASGLTVRVLLLGDYGPHPVFQASDPNVEVLPHWRDYLGWLRKACPALVHSHGYKANILTRIFAPLSGLVSIATHHSGDQGRGVVRLYSLLEEISAFFGPSIAVSPAIEKTLWGRAQVIPNFTLLPKGVSPKPPSQHRRALRVGFVGRLSYEKGPDHFVELANRLPDLAFHLFGDGPERRPLEKKAPTNLIFHGHVASMSGHWDKLDLLCLTSRKEGLPLCVLEAMAHGLPVAGFAVGALPTVVNDGRTGWLNAPEDLDGLTQRLTVLASSDRSLLSQAGTNARRMVARTYSPEAVLPQIFGAYQAAGFLGALELCHD